MRVGEYGDGAVYACDVWKGSGMHVPRWRGVYARRNMRHGVLYAFLYVNMLYAACGSWNACAASARRRICGMVFCMLFYM